MELFNTTGVTTVTAQTTQSLRALILSCDGDILSAMSGVSINIQLIRTGSAGNVDITNGTQPLLQFVGASLGQGVVVSDSTYESQICIPLSPNGAFKINTNETLKIVFTGLTALKTYVLDGLEDNVLSNLLYTYQIKPVASTEKNFNLDVTNFDTMCFTDSNTIVEFNLTDQNGTVKHSYRELKAMEKQFKTVATVQNDGLVRNSIAGYVCLPVAGARKLNIVKDATTTINFLFRQLIQA